MFVLPELRAPSVPGAEPFEAVGAGPAGRVDGRSRCQVEEHVLGDSCHAATRDNDATAIVERSLSLVRRVAPVAAR